MLKRVLSPGRRSKEQPSSPTAGEGPGEALEQQQAGQRVMAAPVEAQAAGGGAGALPPRPPVGLSPFDAPAEPAAKPPLPPSGACGAMGQSMSGPPALGRPSVIKSYLSRDEVCPEAAPMLQQRLSQRLSTVSTNPDVVANAKATLRREAAEVHALPKVSSEELLPCLESVLSFPRGGADAAPCIQAEERQGLAVVGIDPQRAEAVERAVQGAEAGGGEQARRYQA
ncbi:hypothetical protein C2E21_1560 [Chlorella sorokiniana]|uniref:Uncharacterized protein n=1 Tax=Chlorella sorokiniana TaxID=3076 RepID=A0A2P6U023_CHLSO|nr:hypothetical protein C2E21_1560 [Chlorella sorokiniana]|eukprot:PRW59663.1 hypothetical protein C2E21_1560 [Chlorella sorokiniana]